MTATILVVDDDAPIVDIVATILEDEGHTVLRAYNGREALEWLARHGCDLLIADIMMPLLGGLELVAHFHRTTATAPPTILMSAVYPLTPPPPPVVFLPKPFDLVDLLALVERLLDRS